MSFLMLKNSIECPFSLKSNLLILPPQTTLLHSLGLVAHEVVQYSGTFNPETDDGIVVTYTESMHGDSLAALSKTLYSLLKAIALKDPDCAKSLEMDIESPEWKLIIKGSQFFVLTSGPVYGQNHSRYNGGSANTYIVFQTQDSFRRMRPPGYSKIPEATRQSIRNAFNNAQKKYDPTISTGPIEAYRFVKPESIGGPFVKWWLNN